MLNDIKISHIVDELVNEKGMNKDSLIKCVIESIKTVYEKKYNKKELDFSYNKKDDSFFIYEKKQIVEKVKDESGEISLKKAKLIKNDCILGEKINVPFLEKIGRIEIVQIKQLIGQKIREIESELIYKEFINKKGTIVNGIVKKADETGAYVSVFDFQAFLPKSFMIPGERITSGIPIRAIVKDVSINSKNDEKIILERNSVDFIKKLLEIEIPEIFEKIVTIESIFRIPGYKTKVLISSKDDKVNAIGAIVGKSGSRIKNILKELNSERLDLIEFTENIEDLVEKSLKPAIINSVKIKNGIVYIDLSEEERAVAVGKGGKNIYLASKIVNMPIEIINNNKYKENQQEQEIINN